MKSVLLVVWKMCFLTCVLLFSNLKNELFAQSCSDSSYFSIHYQGQSPNYFIQAGITPQNEVVALGKLAFTNQNFVTKFTPQGSVLWSYQYLQNYVLVSWMQFPWYTSLSLSRMAIGKDSSTFLTGTVTEHGETIANSETPPSHQVGVLAKIDKFGNVVWAKTIGAWYTEYSVGNVTALANGDLLVYLISYAEDHDNRIIRLSASGQLIWVTSLVTQWKGVADGVTHAMTELPNGNIVVGDEVYRDQDEIIPRGTYIPPIIIPPPIYYLNMFGLDKTTGKITWNSNYRYPNDTSITPAGFIPDIKHISPLPNGGFSFMTDMYIPVANQIRYSEKAVNIITDATGNLINIVGYNLSDDPCQLINVSDADNSGQQIISVKDSISGQAVLAQIDKDGQVMWTKGYANSSAQLAPSYFTVSASGLDILMNPLQLQSNNLQLLITNKAQNIPCMDVPATLIGANTTWQWELDKIAFTNIPIPVDFGIREFLMKNINYPLQSVVECKNENTCCKDIIDTSDTHKVSLCMGSSYTLPDNTAVKDSGRYYVSYKTSKGCDSTVFYDVTVYKNPQDLMLTKDTCIGGQDSLLLTATSGFYTYNWMNTSTTQPTYTVNKQGIYWVNVNNICGSKTDSVQIYNQCDFPVYMPNAFTPNGDGKNDVFRVPSQNLDRLSRLMVYNRFGKLVFETSDIAKGWDGTISGTAQPAGTYVYYLVMHGLDGKEVSQKGVVILIR